MATLTFRKEERLKGKKDFDAVFKSKTSFILYPFRVFWQVSEGEMIYPAKLGISVPKRNFKLAVKRNRIKRQIREAYRKNKETLYEHLKLKGMKLLIALVYTAKEQITSAETEIKIKEVLLRLNKENAAT